MKNQNSLIFRTTLKDFCPDNNHPHAIDMGEAGIWTCCNVGANSPEEYGGYYAWGEIEEKSIYDWETNKFGSGENKLTKYCTDFQWGLNGFTDNKTELDLSDDVARQKWGGSWRMPSKEELENLVANCTRNYTQVNNVDGVMYTSSNGNRIFFPAAGRRDGTSLGDAGSYGYFWSRTLYAGNPDIAYRLNVYYGCVRNDARSCGHAVRPLRPKN